MNLHTNCLKNKIKNIGAWPAPIPVVMDNQTVKSVMKFTYLGLDIDSQGYSTPEIHRRQGCSLEMNVSVSRYDFQISRSRHFLSSISSRLELSSNVSVSFSVSWVWDERIVSTCVFSCLVSVSRLQRLVHKCAIHVFSDVEHWAAGLSASVSDTADFAPTTCSVSVPSSRGAAAPPRKSRRQQFLVSRITLGPKPAMRKWSNKMWLQYSKN